MIRKRCLIVNFSCVFSDASKYLKEILDPINEVEREDLVDRILETMQRQNCKLKLLKYNVLLQ